MREYACAILVRDDRLLLGYRAPHKQILPCRWDVLGGMIEPGETVDQALARELNEEIGVVPYQYDFLGSVQDPHEADRGGARYHLHRVSRWTGEEPRIRNHEHTRLRWFTLEEACALKDLALLEYQQFFASALV